MSKQYLGETIDIHAGGVDLIFPHHEDEIAQSEAASGRPFAQVWVHGEFLQVDGTKMSKRFGNFLTARDLKESGWDAAAIRYLFGQTHYRKQLNWTDDALKAANAGAQRLAEFHVRLARAKGAQGAQDAQDALAVLARQLESDFRAAMDDDLDMPQAIGTIMTFVREANALLDGSPVSAAARDVALDVFSRVTGVLQIVPGVRHAGGDDLLMAWATGLAEERKKAKWARDWKKADEVRQALLEKGFEVRDNKDGGWELRRTTP
jgi:cysteinyl-tRNA synthetase